MVKLQNRRHTTAKSVPRAKLDLMKTVDKHVIVEFDMPENLNTKWKWIQRDIKCLWIRRLVNAAVGNYVECHASILLQHQWREEKIPNRTVANDIVLKSIKSPMIISSMQCHRKSSRHGQRVLFIFIHLTIDIHLGIQRKKGSHWRKPFSKSC